MSSSQPNGDRLRSVAFLGPLGTYTHQAAFNRFSSTVEYEAKGSIADVCDALSPEIPFAVVPKENSIFGIVVETYDLQRSLRFGTNIFIRDEITLEVQHCLLVRKGVPLKDVTRVLSHEQALGQCTRFLNERLPHAKTVKVPSTAEAAAALLETEYGSDSAAICSKICKTLFDGLDVLFEGIQNEKANLTKFWVLATSPDTRLPGTPSPSNDRYALLRLSNPTNSSNILSVVSALQVDISRIDRRPNLGDTPFRDTYFVEVTRKIDGCKNADPQYTQALENGKRTWRDEIEDKVKEMDSKSWEVCIIGMW